MSAGEDDLPSNPSQWRNLYFNSISMLSSSIRVSVAEDSNDETYLGETSWRGNGRMSLSSQGTVIAKSTRHGLGTKLSLEYMDSKTGSFKEIPFSKEGFLQKTYNFTYDNKDYVLDRMKDSPLPAKDNSFLDTFRKHYKIMDRKTGEVVAMYVSKNSGKKRGVVMIKTDTSEDLEHLILIAIMTRREIQKRAASSGAAAGAAGGAM